LSRLIGLSLATGDALSPEWDACWRLTRRAPVLTYSALFFLVALYVVGLAASERRARDSRKGSVHDAPEAVVVLLLFSSLDDPRSVSDFRLSASRHDLVEHL